MDLGTLVVLFAIIPLHLYPKVNFQKELLQKIQGRGKSTKYRPWLPVCKLASAILYTFVRLNNPELQTHISPLELFDNQPHHHQPGTNLIKLINNFFLLIKITDKRVCKWKSYHPLLVESDFSKLVFLILYQFEKQAPY